MCGRHRRRRLQQQERQALEMLDEQRPVDCQFRRSSKTVLIAGPRDVVPRREVFDMVIQVSQVEEYSEVAAPLDLIWRAAAHTSAQVFGGVSTSVRPFRKCPCCCTEWVRTSCRGTTASRLRGSSNSRRYPADTGFCQRWISCLAQYFCDGFDGSLRAHHHPGANIENLNDVRGLTGTKRCDARIQSFGDRCP